MGLKVVVLPEPAAPSTMATRPCAPRHRADRLRLLPAQRVALLQQARELRLDRLGGQAVAGLGRHAGGHLAERLLHLQRASRRVEPGVGHVRSALGRARRARQPHHLGMAHDALYRGCDRLPAKKARRGIAHALDHVRQAEHRLLSRQTLRQGFQRCGQLADLFLGDVFRLAQQLGDQRLALAETLGLAAPAPVPHLGVVVGRLARPRDLVRRRRPRRVAFHTEAHVICGIDDRRAPLRPVRRKVFRDTYDPGELPVPAILLHGDTEVLLKVPGERIAVGRARRLHPSVNRVLMKRPPLPVLMRPRRVEDHAVGMQLRVVVAAGAVLEHGHRDVGRQHLDLPFAVADSRPPAMAEHRLLQRHTGRIVMRLLYPVSQLRIGDGPQSGHALVGGEGHVETGRAPLAAGVPGQLARAVGRKTVIEAVELPAVDLAAVFQAEQPLRVEPHPVRLLAGRVVLVRMAERALALQVVGGRGRLGERCYHGEIRRRGRPTATAQPGASFRPGIGMARTIAGVKILIGVRSSPGLAKPSVPLQPISSHGLPGPMHFSAEV